MFYDQNDDRAGVLFSLDIVDWSLLLGAIALIAFFVLLSWAETRSMMSTRLFKIAAIVYVAQAAVAFAVGFTLPFFRYFGVLWSHPSAEAAIRKILSGSLAAVRMMAASTAALPVLIIRRDFEAMKAGGTFNPTALSVVL